MLLLPAGHASCINTIVHTIIFITSNANKTLFSVQQNSRSCHDIVQPIFVSLRSDNLLNLIPRGSISRHYLIHQTRSSTGDAFLKLIDFVKIIFIYHLTADQTLLLTTFSKLSWYHSTEVFFNYKILK